MEEKKQKKVTIYDVAMNAGVSPGTVSRTLNNIGYIKEETRNKIMKTVEELHYIPNVAGRILKTTKTNLICFAIPDTSNAIYFRMIESVLRVAKANRYSMLLYYTNGEEEEELNAIRLLQCNTVDALFLINFHYSAKIRSAIEECQQPIVLCGMCKHPWANEEERNFDTISIDVYKGIYDSASYLIQRAGSSKIIYLGGQPDIDVYKQRLDGFKSALSANNLKFDENYSYFYGYTEEGGYKAAAEMVKKGLSSRYICATNDLQAIGFYKYLKECGYNVKKDFEIIGMDNIDVTDFLEISSVIMFEGDVGSRAAELIFLRMKESFKKLCPQDILLEPKLILR